MGLLSDETLQKHLRELSLYDRTFLRKREYAEEVQRAFARETFLYEQVDRCDGKTVWVIEVKGGHEYDEFLAAFRRLTERLVRDQDLAEPLRQVRATIAHLAHGWNECLKDALGVPMGEEPRESLRNLIREMEKDE